MDETIKGELTLRGNGTILLLLAFIAMMVMFIEIMLVPALPIIAQDYHHDASWVSWVLSVYLLVGAVATPLFGRLGDMHGKKRVMILTMSVYVIGLFGCGFSWDMASLIMFRAVQGVGLAMFPLAFGIVRDTFPSRAVPVALGLISAMFSVGVSVGLLGGGWIISELSWRDAFYLITPLFAVLTFVTWKLIDESPLRKQCSLDVWGAALLGGGVLALLFGLTQGEAWGWDSRIWIMLVGALALLIFFYLRERTTRDPLVDLKLMSNRGMLGSNVVAVFTGLSMFLMFQTLPFFLMAPEAVGGFGISNALTVGLYMFPSAISQLFFGPFAGHLSKRIGPDKVLAMGMMTFFIGFVMLILLHSTPMEVIAAMLVSGIGIGMTMVALINLVVQSCPASEFGLASGINSLFRVIGGAVGPVLGAVIMAQFVVLWSASPSVAVILTTETGYIWAWVAGALSALVGFLIAVVIHPEKGTCYEDFGSARVPAPTNEPSDESP
jgi:EmrB/QacA subfamily drug resistance transporter